MLDFAQQNMSQDAADRQRGAMRIITIEEHWTSAGLDQALRAQPPGIRDDSLALNDFGEVPARLPDLGPARIEAMDAAGIDVQILSLAPPGTGGLPGPEAAALSRDANEQMSAAAARYPAPLRAMTSLPLSDPDAARAERTARDPAHVGIMTYGR